MSITARLWLYMVLLVLAVLSLAGAVQSRTLADTFYAQQAQQLLEEGRRLAAALAVGRTDEVARTAENLAEALQINVMVLDREGRVLSCSGLGGMMRGTGPGPAGGSGARMRHRYGAAWHGLTYPQEEWRQGREVVVRGPNPMFEGEMLTVVVPVPGNGGVDGAVLLHKPLAPLAAQALALQKTALAALGGGLLLATLLSVLLSRRLSRPLLAMRRLALAVAAGDYSVRAPVVSRDEVGQLAAALNTLAERLQEKIRELERVDRARREFVASVSHELRTPLTIIQGYTEALLDGLVHDAGDREAHLKEILEEVLRLRRLVDDLLDLRRIEAGALPLARQAVDLGELVARVQEQFSGLAGKKGLVLTTTAPPALPRVLGDPDRLQQVLINLVDNALRVTPAGGRVEVELRPDGRAGVELLVRDTGPGIPPDELPLIWERFYKGDPARRRTGGAGLGLAIVRAIVEAHGGRVDVESEPGRGTTFRVTLPAAPRPEYAALY